MKNPKRGIDPVEKKDKERMFVFFHDSRVIVLDKTLKELKREIQEEIKMERLTKKEASALLFLIEYCKDELKTRNFIFSKELEELIDLEIYRELQRRLYILTFTKRWTNEEETLEDRNKRLDTSIINANPYELKDPKSELGECYRTMRERKHEIARWYPYAGYRMKLEPIDKKEFNDYQQKEPIEIFKAHDLNDVLYKRDEYLE